VLLLTGLRNNEAHEHPVENYSDYLHESWISVGEGDRKIKQLTVGPVLKHCTKVSQCKKPISDTEGDWLTSKRYLKV
jgi:hypothetical protein